MKTSFDDKLNVCAGILGTSIDDILTKYHEDKTIAEAIINSLKMDELELTLPRAESVKSFQVTAAARILKEDNTPKLTESPFQHHARMNPSEPHIGELISKLHMNTKPIQNWSDSELLDAYIETEEYQYEVHLVNRSRGRPFIVTDGIGSSRILKDESLRILKKARKGDTPEYYRDGDGNAVNLYRISELSVNARTREESPLAKGHYLFDGHCAQCDLNFEKVDMKSRQFMRLVITDFPNTDIKELHKTALIGIDALMNEYPMVAIKYHQLSLIDELPTLRKLEKPKKSN